MQLLEGFFAHLDLALSSREEFSDVFKKLASPIVCVCFQSVLEGYLDFITTKNALSSLRFPKSEGGRVAGEVGSRKKYKIPLEECAKSTTPKKLNKDQHFKK